MAAWGLDGLGGGGADSSGYHSVRGESSYAFHREFDDVDLG